MENIGRAPGSVEARDALASIQDVQQALRDTPWPTWLYPFNAVLLGALALTPLLEENRSSAVLALALAVVTANVATGYRMGTPWVLPASRGFLVAVVASISCVVAALVISSLSARVWPILVLGGATTTLYLVGAVMHRGSTRNPR